MMRILFLHTLVNNQVLFSPLLKQRLPEYDVVHDVKEHFLTSIREQGVTASNRMMIHAYLQAQLEQSADVIVCTCSTLGPIVDDFPSNKVFRVDKPMASMAADYENILVVVTLKSTLEPTTDLLKKEAPSCHVDFLCIEGAWQHYEKGDLSAFNQLISDGVTQALRSGNHDAVMLAQASMFSAIGMLNLSVPVLSSPSSCIDFLQQYLGDLNG